MTEIKPSDKSFLSEVAHLTGKLAEAEEVLNAIRDGRVDAVVVSGPRGDRIYTLKGADYTYRVLIETMTEGAVILAEDGTILYCNGRFAEMVQTPIENVMGKSMIDFVGISEKDRFNDILKRASAHNIRDEMRIHPGGSHPIPVLLSMRSLSTEEMKSVCMVVTDLTRQKQSEQKLKAFAEALQYKNKELSRRAEQLSRLSSELTLSEQRERQRFAKILHDHLQQMLVGAKLGLETIALRVTPEHRQPLRHIAELLKESLDASRSLTVELCPPILYEGGLVQALEWLSRWMKEKHRLEVALDADARAVPEGESMKVLLFEAVRELLFNVVKHAGVDSAQVEMIRKDGEDLKITVSDQGAGFDSKNLWESTDPNSGGFGLFSIRERLSLLGGRFEVTSTPGGGTVVSLMAPLVKGKTAEPDSNGAFLFEATEVSETSAAPEVGKKTRVMLVDDHAVMRRGLSALLDLQSDIQTVGEASDGAEAVHMARKLRPDVILMDISMPKMNGIEATRIIHSEFPDIRIIGLSMFDPADQAASVLRAGASAYLSKSGSPDVLLSAIRNGGHGAAS
ncbi:MAG: response regulator [Desulfobacteraceae bacterium]|nr:MAG: response regulator [Desulfobacteraceae bacterium]